jgi:acetolactate synthase I/II/III large subunit
MNGAESLVHTLLASGVDTCFANPGTSEMHFVAALDRIPGMRCILCLFEGVATGAADGYGRMTGRPAVTLLHCGPGLANGMTALHDARRAGAPIVNCVGDQATYHAPLDPPMTTDTEAWARGVSAWVRTARRAGDVGRDAAAAVQAARTAAGQVATLVLPSNTCWDEGGKVAEALPPVAPGPVPPGAVEQAARILRSGEPVLMVLGGAALRAGPIADARRIAAATGAHLRAQMLNARIERGAGRHPIDAVPYPVDWAVKALAGAKHVILVGAPPPVGFFAYPNKPGYLFPADAAVHVLARPEQDAPEALAALADVLGVPAVPVPSLPRAEMARGAVTPEAFGQSLAALLPEHAIVVEESITAGRGLYPTMHGAAPHDWLEGCGGGIGMGPPLSVGAAVAAPGRRVVTLQGDGSAAYTLQSLWTQARERLDVTTIIMANRKYAILLHELSNVGANPGRTALDMLDLTNPAIDWVRISEGFGVAAARAETMEQFNDLFRQSCATPGPFLIELAIG